MAETLVEWFRTELKNTKRNRKAIATDVGISLSYLNKLATGERVPPVDLWQKLATSFGVSGDAQELLLFQFYSSPQNQTHEQTDLRRQSLPTAFTSFVGRDREVVDVQGLLQKSRLVTVLGPGGVGKTRLALRVAEMMQPEFADGVIFVPLEHITNSNAVLPEIGQRLGVKEGGKITFPKRLAAFLYDKHLLLVLDNLEQVSEAAPIIAALLSVAHSVKILVTSRTVLRVYGEQEYMVPPLGLPDLHNLPTLDNLAQYPSVALFLQRAQATQPDFALTPENAESIAAICACLEGLPLAIELAAARIKLLPPPVLLHRLTNKLAVLANGARSLPLRQQTMRGCIAWSYDLLAPTEQILLSRLAVFSGGWTLSAAENVCGDNQTGSVLDGIGELINHSLVQPAQADHPEPRYMMLEIIRDYALEQLHRSDDESIIWQRYIDHFVRIARWTVDARKNLQSWEWMDDIEQEHENYRTVLRRLLDQKEVDGALWLCGILGTFWYMRGYMAEGQFWLETALATERPVPNAIRAKALMELARFVGTQRESLRAIEIFKESLALYRELEDKRRIALVLNGLGWVTEDGNRIDEALAYYSESVSVMREIGDKEGIAGALANLGNMIQQKKGDYTAAERMYAESFGYFRELNDQIGIAEVLHHMGQLAFAQGNIGQAWTQLVQSLAGFYALRYTEGIIESLERLAPVAIAQDKQDLCFALMGNAESLRNVTGHVVTMEERHSREEVLWPIRIQAGDTVFAVAWAKACTRTSRQVMDWIEEFIQTKSEITNDQALQTDMCAEAQVNLTDKGKK